MALALGTGITQTLVAWTDDQVETQGVGLRLYEPLRGRTTLDPQTAIGHPLGVALASNASPAGTATQWHWDLGDGTHSASRYPQHTYQQGTFDVTLTFTDTSTGESAVQVWPNLINVSGRTVTYTYDPLGRLVKADYQTGEEFAYEYDAVGNRLALTQTTSAGESAVTTYAYDAANRLTTVQNPDASSQDYVYDMRGNLISDGETLYAYNGAGRMVQALTYQTTVVYTYTASGLRVAQEDVLADDVQTYAWDWATSVPEMLTDGRYTYLVGHGTVGWYGSKTPLGMLQWTYALPDALGSVRQETDATGAVIAAREWSPFGVAQGTAQSGLGYTGEWFDTGVGLQYLRARWYDGDVGRFTQRDPLATSTFYRYASNNPINRVDPTGYIDWSACVLQDDYAMCTLQTGDTYYKLARELSAMGVAGSLGQIVADLTALNTQQYPNPDNIPVGGTLTVRAAWLQPSPTSMPPSMPYLPSPILESWWEYPDNVYPNNPYDLTEWFYNELATNANSYYVQRIGQLIKTVNIKKGYDAFYNLVRDRAKWDFKHNIKKTLQGERFALSAGGQQNWYEYSVPGNIHYGFVGRAAGIPDFMLYAGAGYAEVFDPSHVTNGEACCRQICLSEVTFTWPDFPYDKVCPEKCAYVNPDWTQSYFDDPNDKAGVEFGIRMYDTYGSTLTWRQYQEYLSLHGHELTPAPGGNNTVPTNADWPYQIGFFNGPDDVANESIISALLEK